jgi:hypothetical protein
MPDPTPAPETEETEAGPKFDWVDAVGIFAGIVLIVIVADVFTDGRLISRRLRSPRPEPAPEEVPVD